MVVNVAGFVFFCAFLHFAPLREIIQAITN